jgi:cell division septation protein DedD
MNDGNMKEKSPEKRAGKEFVIVIVIVFSSLSFTLGFFVGKKSERSSRELSSQSMTLSPESGQAGRSAAAQEILPAAAGAPDRDIAQDRPPGENDRLQPPAEPFPPRSDGAGGRGEKGADTAAKGPAEEIRKGTTVSPEITRTDPAKGVVYSVQLGALKNAAEAKRLKDTYSRKGYPTYITVVSGKNKEKTYKVKAGKFRDRKDAELLSIKLKKNGDLNAFVTSGNG